MTDSSLIVLQLIKKTIHRIENKKAVPSDPDAHARPLVTSLHIFCHNQNYE